ncbi:MAG: hypothetical protein KJ970_07720 [Candidatus Eisenbacteria bacterium]|uniref:Peptidase C-terminal archaeal/bacterial domain-containing protein n=1 Tax=Eiseniibacteriota bacterium TaxID=2212470 RepID=A0A948WCC7_UNCEI|nr:hypothetical protein [Candidatus Eisenbacteria bacterium]MBU1947079.1 hypothetical protein [Candidatus Eisenbacteria bacterium]MBU2690803.1 hypothetical protein [Candidatus Eisenbacteria bacterium]
MKARPPVLLLIFVSLLLISPHRSCPQSNPVDAGQPLTRSDMILNADEYARVHWTLREINLTGTNCGGGFLSEYETGPRIGMAYKYGGWDRVPDFLKMLDEGYGAGTGAGARVYEHYSQDCVTGISCTGLVSRAWNLKSKYTLNYEDPRIPRKFQEIASEIPDVDLREGRTALLRKGDALINKSHIILFIYETKDKQPKVIDSTRSGVHFHKTTWGRLAKEGYRAIRYHHIVEVGDPAGTATNPVEISSEDFPLRFSGNTRDFVSMEFDSYDINPARVEQGPESIFKLKMDQPGVVVMNVTDFKSEDIDNNIYLLDSLNKDENLMATHCINSGDITLSSPLNSGIYYIVVDSGPDLPGEFVLTIDYR